MPNHVPIYRFECPDCPRQVFASRGVVCECGNSLDVRDRTLVGSVLGDGGD